MRSRTIRAGTGFLMLLAIGWSRPSPAVAQSLGGYGVSAGLAGSGMGGGGGGAMVIPYGGMTEGFMPGRMGGGSPFRLRSRPDSSLGPPRTSSGLSSMSGGMRRGIGARSSLSSPMGLRGMGSVGGSSGSRPGMGVMPTVIGYPFRQPPSPSPSSTGASGMPM